MPNPFFNTGQYPWHLPLAMEFYRELVNSCPQRMTERLIQAAGLELTDITWPAPMNDAWSEILGKAARKNRLEALLKSVLETDDIPRVHPVARRVQSAEPPPGTDVCAQVVLPGEMPFLNREKLRNALRRMREDTVLSILLVRGQPQSGKTMTTDLVREVAKAHGDEVLYLYEEIAARVDKVVDYLFKRLGQGPTPLPPQDTTDSAWYTQVGLAALERASKANRRWWIIVDNLGPDANGQPRMDREVLALFHQFALLMADPGFSRYFRLILLDYPSTPNHPPSKLRRNLLEQDVTSPLTDADVAAFVKAVLDSRMKQYSQADVETLTQALVQKANALHAREPESGPMAALNKTLAEWLTEIRP